MAYTVVADEGHVRDSADEVALGRGGFAGGKMVYHGRAIPVPVNL
jgi:hypothetical protein